MTLHERIAKALDWPLSDVEKHSLYALREIVRPISPKLAHELTVMIRGGFHIVR